MNCDEFAMAGLDLNEAGKDKPLRRAAQEHLLACASCASLHENWQALRVELRDFGAETDDVRTPARVEMRLRQEFRTRHKTQKVHRFAALAGWGLAAGLILGTFLWANWKHERDWLSQAVKVPMTGGSRAGQNAPVVAGPEIGETLVAANDAGDFTLLPGTMPGTLEDAMVVRVQMQRSVLGSLGLTVSGDRASDWIQVDLLVGDDGQPQAVRLPQSTD